MRNSTLRSEWSANVALGAQRRDEILRKAYVNRRCASEPVRVVFAPDTRSELQKAHDRLTVRGVLMAQEAKDFRSMLTPEAAARVDAAFAKARGGAL